MAMNEAALIRWIRAHTAKTPEIRIGIGDDAACVRADSGRDWILKTDMVIEGVHFDRAMAVEDWGRKAIRRNVSDFAAMGGIPKYCLISLALPPFFGMEKAKRLYGAMEADSRHFHISIVGGDTTRAKEAVISVAMVGVAETGTCIRRSGAVCGDRVFVTGPLGGSLQTGWHLKFTPRLAESIFLKRNYHVHAMIDVSDGLSADLGHIAGESGVGLRIEEERVPLRRGVKGIERAFLDGEDYELAFTLSEKEAARLRRDVRTRMLRMDFIEIGVVESRRMGCRIRSSNGKTRPFPSIPDHHFGIRAKGGVVS